MCAHTFEGKRMRLPGLELLCGHSLPESIGLGDLWGLAPSKDDNWAVTVLLGQLPERRVRKDDLHAGRV